MTRGNSRRPRRRLHLQVIREFSPYTCISSYRTTSVPRRYKLGLHLPFIVAVLVVGLATRQLAPGIPIAVVDAPSGASLALYASNVSRVELGKDGTRPRTEWFGTAL